MKRGFIFIFLLAIFAQAVGQSTAKYQIKFLEVNKDNSDYGVAILDENKLIFTSANEDPSKVKKNYNPRKDLFVGDIDFDGEIKGVKPVVKKAPKRYNQTGLAYTKDQKTVYFTRNKYSRKKRKQAKPKNKRVVLYKADVAADGSWTDIKKLPFNKKKVSITNPVLSADDTQLFFASDMKPSQGKTDIFVVDIRKDGSYSKPRNLGTFVNTNGTETSPFITNDNILYFSSDGHPGQGKLDIFAVEVFESSTSEIYQLASPINSINDDFAYIVNQDNNQGFFTSNRLQGAGFNDLYSFTLEEDVRPENCFITVDGYVRDKETLDVIGGATVDLYNIDGELLESVNSYADGSYKFTVACANEYKLIGSKPDYSSEERYIEILEENYHEALHMNLNLTRIRKEVTAEALQPIYYDFDKAVITSEAAAKMDRIAEVMIDNPELVIEAASYTDARGTDAYNQRLSERRAKAAVEYLISKGIDATRIKSRGFGEEKMTNQCVNGVNCTEHAHQLNRRTEFNFINTPSTGAKKESAPKATGVAISRTAQRKEVVEEIEVANKLQPIQDDMKAVERMTAEPIAIAKNNEVAEAEELEEAPAFDSDNTEESVEVAEEEVIQTDVAEPIEVAEVISNDIEEIEETEVADVVEVAEEVEVAEVAEVIEEEVNSPSPVVVTQPRKAVRPEELKFDEVIEEEVAAVDEMEIKAQAKQDMLSEEKEELAKFEREKASYRADEKDYTKVNQKEVQEAVVINYNSSIVATNPESNKVLNYISTEKVKMIDQLNEIEKQYDEAIDKYPSVSDSLIAEKQRIAAVIQKAENLKETGWSNIIDYKNNVLHFKRKFRELVVMNNRGTLTTSTEDKGPGSITVIEEQPVVEVAAKEESVKENLAIDDVKITAMKMNGRGKYQETNSANKTDLIKVTFKLLSKGKTDRGRKDAHLVIQNPEGQVTEAKGIFTMKDSQTESKYTDHAIINYNNHDVDVTMFIQRRGSHFEKGVYPVKLFVEGELMAVSNLNLENSF